LAFTLRKTQVETAMTCIHLDSELTLARREADMAGRIRAGVFWGFILLVIASPALLGAVLMSQG